MLVKQFELQKPMIVAADVAVECERLWLAIMRPFMTANDYLDAAHALGETMEATVAMGNKQHEMSFSNRKTRVLE